MGRPSLERALALKRAGRWAEVERACLDVLAREADHEGALLLAGECALRAGRMDVATQRLFEVARRADGNGVEPALRLYARAVEAAPGRADMHHWHGEFLHALDRFEEAEAAFRRSLRVDPRQPGTWFCLGQVLMRRPAYDEAAAAFASVIELLGESPRYTQFVARAHGELGVARLRNGEQEAAVLAIRRARDLAPSPSLHSQLIATLHYLPEADAEMILREAREWDRRYAARPTTGAAPPGPRADPERRLRVGYVSGDYKSHPHGYFLPPVFERHDRESFEVFAYSNVARPDPGTARFRGMVDSWRDISALDDESAARRIRDDGIDVLVDLSLHTGDGRLLTFARRPAPVQVSWLGYPGTTGLGAIDYRVTDPHLDPPDLDMDAYPRAYVEKPIRLDTFWCYRPLQTSIEVSPLPARAAGHVTFGHAGKTAKVTPDRLDLWARVLREVPGSRCLLRVSSQGARGRIHERLNEAGVSPDRVDFVGQEPPPRFLSIYQRIDVGLDTLPYCGHTTSLEAFFMGVPVVTEVGRTAVGRAGAGFARNLGLGELVADGDDAYVAIAAGLARDLDRLERMRAGLRARMSASPLMDEARFVGQLEQGYREAWRRRCAGRA